MRDSILRRLPALLAIASLVTIAGCSLAPKYEEPPLPVVDAWPIPPETLSTGSDEAEAAATEAVRPEVSKGERPTMAAEPVRPEVSKGERPTMAAEPVRPEVSKGERPPTAADIGWRDFFLDPRLEKVLALALDNNRDLRVALLNVERARAAYRIQRADRLPSVGVTAQGARQGLPESQGGGVAEQYSVDLGVTAFELDLFGRVRSLSEAALHRFLAEEQAQRATQLLLVAEVARAWLTLAADRELLRLAERTLETEQRGFELITRQHELGAVSGLVSAQARTTVETARVDVERFRGNVAQDINALTLLAGAPVPEALLPDSLDVDNVGLPELPVGVPSEVLLRRPDVIQAEHLLRAANANIGAARAAFFPSISLTGSVGTASNELSGLFDSGSDTWSFVPRIDLPIFDMGRRSANLDVAEVDRDIALARYEQAIQSGFREVADALALSDALARQRAAQADLAQATENAYELSQERYRAGLDSFLTTLDSQRAWYRAQQALVSVRLQEAANRARLYTVLGGGWRAQTAPPPPPPVGAAVGRDPAASHPSGSTRNHAAAVAANRGSYMGVVGTRAANP